jgi:hypothetical protein
MWHINLDAIVASHQDTILSLAQMGNTHGQPDADRQQGEGECESRNIRQHPLPVIIPVFRDVLVTRQVVGDPGPVNE